MIAKIILYTALLLFSFNAKAEEIICLPVVGNNSEGIEIGNIKIINQDIFDSKHNDERSTIHRIANKLHWKTRAETIRQQLLIQPGQPYKQRLIEESERLLRAKSYLHLVKIYPHQICHDKVDIIVNTSDNWTLTPSVSFARSGGINRTSFEITESNLIGRGKSITLKSVSNEDRDSQFLHYIDDNVLGSRYQLNFKTANNSDGYSDSISIGKPFFQLNSKQSLRLHALKDKKAIATYNNGLITDNTGQLSESVNMEYGWSSGLHNQQLIRYKIGWNATDKQYVNTLSYPFSALPEDKIMQTPYFAIEYFEEKYIQRENFNVMAVTEDISTGNHLTARIGLFSQSWGSTNTGLKLSANYSFGLQVSENTLAFIKMGLSSETNQEAVDYHAVSLEGRLLYTQDSNHSYNLKASYQAANNLLAIDEYVIGGDTGLRGYPIRYQTGLNKALLSVEKRLYFNWYPWKLAKFGIAVYTDIGSAWGKDESANFISDVGIGIRLVSTRQSDVKVLHIDFSHPLNEQDDVENFQLLIKAKSQF